MAKKLALRYDPEGDILDVFIGKPKEAIHEEIAEDVFIRKDLKTSEIRGFMIMNFAKLFREATGVKMQRALHERKRLIT